MRGVRIFSSCLLLQLLLLQLQHLMLHAAGADGSDQPGSGTGASSSLEREGEAAGTGGDTEIIDGSSLSSELGRPTLLELMRAARLERTLLNKPKGKAAGFASLFDTTKLMAVFVTVAVLLYAVRVRTRRYTADVRSMVYCLGFGVLGWLVAGASPTFFLGVESAAGCCCSSCRSFCGAHACFAVAAAVQELTLKMSRQARWFKRK